MKQVRWNLAKSEELKRHRGVSFEEMIQSELLAVKKH
ncbi:MAG TPA: toxin, partial [Deltaproteobacteria bacterium]|nr:toxin [Deltaproteobacteria bacterium]